jgi:tRNA U38,U39,U40 pseudouridine synthase TruA
MLLGSRVAFLYIRVSVPDLIAYASLLHSQAAIEPFRRNQIRRMIGSATAISRCICPLYCEQ